MTKQYTKSTEEFDSNQYLKLVSAINKILPNYRIESLISEDKLYTFDNIATLDLPNICIIVAVSNRAKRLLSHYLPSDYESCKVPELNYVMDSTYFPATSKYSINYIKKIIGIFDLLSDCVKISLKNNYPSTFENDDFKIMLAPRVGKD